MAGTHHSKQRGTSAEFTEYRLYRQGDDPRRIDWRLLARSDRAYIRLATDRAILPTMIVLDASASMAFPVATRAEVATRARARGWTRGGRARRRRSGRRRGATTTRGRDARVAAAHAARRGGRDRARGRRGRARAEPTPLAPTVGAMRTARIAIITDLLGDADELLRVARVHIVAGGEVHLDPCRRARRARSAAPARCSPPIRSSRRCNACSPTRRAPAYERAFAEWRDEMARRVARRGRGVHRGRNRRAGAARRAPHRRARRRRRRSGHELADFRRRSRSRARRRWWPSRCTSSRAAGRSPSRCRRRGSFRSEPIHARTRSIALTDVLLLLLRRSPRSR